MDERNDKDGLSIRKTDRFLKNPPKNEGKVEEQEKHRQEIHPKSVQKRLRKDQEKAKKNKIPKLFIPRNTLMYNSSIWWWNDKGKFKKEQLNDDIREHILNLGKKHEKEMQCFWNRELWDEGLELSRIRIS
jgi:hypothetical protein